MHKRFEISDIVFIGGILIFSIIVIYPLLYLLSISLSDNFAVVSGQVSFYPIGLNFRAYEVFLSERMIARAYFNTILYAGLGTMITLVMCSLAAYPLAIPGFKAKKFFMFVFAFTMYFNGGMIPTFLLIRDLGMIDTIWAMVIPAALSVYYIILLRTFFMSIPSALRESAMIEGANDVGILVRIILPLSKPVMATITLFAIVAQWNAFFAPLLYLNSDKLYPIQMILRKIVISSQMKSVDDMAANFDDMIVSESVKAAAVIFTVLPITLIYPFIQKYFTKGMMIGSLKG